MEARRERYGPDAWGPRPPAKDAHLLQADDHPGQGRARAQVGRNPAANLPRATILTFWHIPWPNAERFGICPWEREVLEGLLGSSGPADREAAPGARSPLRRRRVDVRPGRARQHRCFRFTLPRLASVRRCAGSHPASCGRACSGGGWSGGLLGPWRPAGSGRRRKIGWHQSTPWEAADGASRCVGPQDGDDLRKPLDPGRVRRDRFETFTGRSLEPAGLCASPTPAASAIGVPDSLAIVSGEGDRLRPRDRRRGPPPVPDLPGLPPRGLRSAMTGGRRLARSCRRLGTVTLAEADRLQGQRPPPRGAPGSRR
jgi:hypothetical protein